MSFDFRKFLIENKLTTTSRLDEKAKFLTEADDPQEDPETLEDEPEDTWNKPGEFDIDPEEKEPTAKDIKGMNVPGIEQGTSVGDIANMQYADLVALAADNTKVSKLSLLDLEALKDRFVAMYNGKDKSGKKIGSPAEFKQLIGNVPQLLKSKRAAAEKELSVGGEEENL